MNFTLLEIALLWFILGTFINIKLNWYKNHWSNNPENAICLSYIAAPLVFAIIVFDRVFLKKW